MSAGGAERWRYKTETQVHSGHVISRKVFGASQRNFHMSVYNQLQNPVQNYKMVNNDRMMRGYQ